MKTIELSGWYGRTGNNIISLFNIIVFSLQNNIDKIIFPYNEIFNTNEIIINAENVLNQTSNEIIYGNNCEYIYFMKINNEIKYHIKEKEIFNKYIKPIIKKELYTNLKTNDIVLYTRSADVFFNSENNYTQAPLYFYKEVLKRENKNNGILVSEDLLNPVANFLHTEKICEWNKNDFLTDLNILLNSEVIALSYSTLNIYLLLLSEKIKRAYIPKYVYDYFIEHWKVDFKDLINENQEIILIDLPNYTKIGDFFTKKQEVLDYMITYNSCS